MVIARMPSYRLEYHDGEATGLFSRQDYLIYLMTQPRTCRYSRATGDAWEAAPLIRRAVNHPQITGAYFSSVRSFDTASVAGCWSTPAA